MEEKRICAECGKSFIPYTDEDECCSAFCRSMHRISMIDKSCKEQMSSQKAQLEAIKKPPNFDLKHCPKARVEWFMALPDEYKRKFNKFLSSQEIEWAREIAQKNLAEERLYSGFYVKKGKIVETKRFADNEDNHCGDIGRTDGDDDDTD